MFLGNMNKMVLSTFNVFLIVLLMLILISTTCLDVVFTEDTEHYTSLKDLKGKTFKLYKVRRITRPNTKSGIIKLDELNEWLSQVLYLITCEPSRIFTRLQMKGYSMLNEEKIYVFEYKTNKTRLIVALGDLGHFYIRINSGRANEYESCNVSFRNYLENIKSAIRGRLPDKPEFLKIVWKGQYGEKTAYMITGHICNVTNNTTTCYVPTSRINGKVFYNPYEVYYFYLEGYRLEPPLKVRCCNPKLNDGFSAVYVEGFIPTLGRELVRVRIDDKYLDEILSQIREAGVNVDDPGKLLVEDIYLSLGRNETLTPFIVLRYQNLKFWIAIEDRHPLLTSYGSFVSSTSVSEYHGEVKIDWDNILANIKPLNTQTNNNVVIDLSILLIVIVVIVVIIFVMKKRSK